MKHWERMTSERTDEFAIETPDGWTVSWLPGLFWDKIQAWEALTLADIYALKRPPDDPIWRRAERIETVLDIDPERYRP